MCTMHITVPDACWYICARYTGIAIYAIGRNLSDDRQTDCFTQRDRVATLPLKRTGQNWLNKINLDFESKIYGEFTDDKNRTNS